MIYVMGDLEGNWEHVGNFYKTIKKEEGKSTLILLGDASLNFFLDYRDEQAKIMLGEYPLTYFVIRGNHEERPSICADREPDKWHKEIFWKNWVWVENEYPYIKYAMDFVSLYSCPPSYKLLVIPGAYSVDKEYRLQKGWPYFPTEQLTKQEMQDGLEIIKEEVDYILSHSCPKCLEPFIQDLFRSYVDQSKVDKTTEEYLQKIVSEIKYKRLYFGHYHDNRDIAPYKATMLYHQAIPLGTSLSTSLFI